MTLHCHCGIRTCMHVKVVLHEICQIKSTGGVFRKDPGDLWESDMDSACQLTGLVPNLGPCGTWSRVLLRSAANPIASTPQPIRSGGEWDPVASCGMPKNRGSLVQLGVLFGWYQQKQLLQTKHTQTPLLHAPTASPKRRMAELLGRWVQ